MINGISPAFPIPDQGEPLAKGLTKREYIATSLLQGILSNSAALTEQEMEEAVLTAISVTLKLEQKLPK